MGAAIGRRRRELVTPALVLDLPAAQRNIEHMAARIAQLPADIRPHIKVHKSPELARLQVDAGAIGLSVATVWEAIVLVAAGFDHVFVVNTVAGPGQDPGARRAGPRRRRLGRRRRRRERRGALGGGGARRVKLGRPDRGRYRDGPLRGRHGRRGPGARPGPGGPSRPPLPRVDRLRGPLLAYPRATSAAPTAARGHGFLSGVADASRREGFRARSGRPAGRRPGNGPPPTRASPRSRPAHTWSWTTSMARWCRVSSTR